MSFRIATLGAALLAALLLSSPRTFAADEKPPLQQLFMDIHLLQLLNRVRLSDGQLQELCKACQALGAERNRLETRHDTPEVRAAAAAVRQALLENRSPEELGPLYEKLEMARQKDGGEEMEDPEQQLAAVAREQSRNLISGLTADQVVRLVGEEEEDGFAQQLFHELREARKAPDAAQKAFVTRTSLRLSLELSQDPARSGKARGELEAALNRLLKLPEADLDAQREPFAREIGQIVNRTLGSPLGEIQWRAERRLSGMLMHPRLAAVLDERLRSEGKGR